jgi:DUF4097 and DUF4098 domain-containing protein YvlB
LLALLQAPVTVGSGQKTATANVKGPITFRLDSLSADVEVGTSSGKQVTITLVDSDANSVALIARGDDRMEAEFDGQGKLRSGHVRVELPKGSSVDIKTVSGELIAKGPGGDVRFRSMSGDAHVGSAQNVEINTVSGEVRIKEAAGMVRVHTVSGDAEINSTAGTGAQLEYESTSGDLHWSGACGPKCRITSSTVSGDAVLSLDPKASSFDLRFQSHSGDISDGLGIQKSGEGQGRYGKGEGVVEVRSFSGDLSLKKK